MTGKHRYVYFLGILAAALVLRELVVVRFSVIKWFARRNRSIS